jgi:hypothetical protein
VRFSTATDPAHVALFKRKDITAIALDFPSAAASQPGEVGFSRERSADEVDKDLLRTNSELLATRLAAAKETSKKALATIAADYDSKITAAQTNVNEANAKLQTAAASAANSQVAANNAAAQAAHTGGGAHMMALQEQRMAQRAYDKAAKDGQAAQKSLNGAKAELQTLTTQKDADMARVSSQSSALEPALHDVLNMHAMVLFFGGTLSAADMEANFAAEGTAAPAAAPPPAKDPAPAPKGKGK